MLDEEIALVEAATATRGAGAEDGTQRDTTDSMAEFIAGTIESEKSVRDERKTDPS